MVALLLLLFEIYFMREFNDILSQNVSGRSFHADLYHLLISCLSHFDRCNVVKVTDVVL